MIKKIIPILLLSTLFSCSKKEITEVEKASSISSEKFLEKVNMVSDKVDIETIKKASLNFVSNGFNKSINKLASISQNNKQIKNITEYKSKDKSTILYIINYVPTGFVVMSDNMNADPILAFSDNGYFNINDIEKLTGLDDWIENSLDYVNDLKRDTTLIVKENLMKWNELLNGNYNITNTKVASSSYDSQRLSAMNQRMYQINQLRPSSTVYPLSYAASVLPPERLSHFKSIAQQYGSPEQYTIVEILDKTTIIEKGPLMNTHWEQGGVFAAEVPNDYAGCTATAAGQIMNYYKYPSSFNWNNMAGNNLFIYNDISFFMKELGVRFKMEYDTDGSGAQNSDVKTGLESYGYSVIKKDDNHTDVRNAINSNKPVYVSGCRTLPNGGKSCHAWVTEGYKDYTPSKAYRIEWQTSSYTYQTNNIEYLQTNVNTTTHYYVNWGWGSNYNGWYLSNYHNSTSNGRNYNLDKENLYINKP